MNKSKLTVKQVIQSYVDFGCIDDLRFFDVEDVSFSYLLDNGFDMSGDLENALFDKGFIDESVSKIIVLKLYFDLNGYYKNNCEFFGQKFIDALRGIQGIKRSDVKFYVEDRDANYISFVIKDNLSLSGFRSSKRNSYKFRWINTNFDVRDGMFKGRSASYSYEEFYIEMKNLKSKIIKRDKQLILFSHWIEGLPE